MFFLVLTPLQSRANFYYDICSKWAYYGSAFVYWNLLLGPALEHVAGQIPLVTARSYLKKEGPDSVAPDLKHVAPGSYAAIQNMLRQDGLSSLDDHVIKKGLTEEWTNFGDSIICIPPNEFVHSESESSYHIADHEKAAAILSHEMEHSRKSHIIKRVLVCTAATIMAVFLANKIGDYCIFKNVSPGSYPTVIQSLLRIPLALGAVFPVQLLDAWYSRSTERQADAVLEKSPRLALKFSEYIKQTQLPLEIKFEEEQGVVWDNAHNGRASQVGWIDKLLSAVLSRQDFVEFKIKNLSSHPPARERIAYLEKWGGRLSGATK